MDLGSWLNFAHATSEAVHEFNPSDDLESQVSSLALNTVVYAAIALVVLVIIASLTKDRVPRLKMPIFVLMTISMLGSITVLLGSTIYLNTNAESGGPIHWHADFEIWACGNQLELRDPQGRLTNKVGTATLHEHNDQRIHLEGVVVEKRIDASVGKFMYVVGGEISDSTLVVPLNDMSSKWFEDEIDGDGPSDTYSALIAQNIFNNSEEGTVARFVDGQKCGEEESDVQVYVYHYDEANQAYWQEKVSSPEYYAINEEPNVPPGDCIIIEFGPLAQRTNKLCEQYGIRDIAKCEAFGVTGKKKSICTLREVGLVTESGEVIELDELSLPEPATVPDLEGLEESDA